MWSSISTIPPLSSTSGGPAGLPDREPDLQIAPEDMEAVLETGIPDLDKEMGKSIDGKTVTPATLVADLVSDYTWIYNNYSGMKGDKDLAYIHASNEYQDFAAKLRFMYNNLGDYFDHAVSYPWVTISSPV